MFGGPPPKPSPEEQAIAVRQTRRELRGFAVTAASLYIAPWLLAPIWRALFSYQ
ncbi:hypothetical protein BCV69DRAFT_300360 [Microstroma glucosiphilum]|uniref:Uncharacterized protein n=1 Tax=Pseudomicrostroma glucosiphilum TaxID=1684307 RepID=A0A316U2G6_9BASI|nr:hypothetical protein BCV69DRAFT_300360 [Pseudomicrostroma glucosiphilum]PWN19536.1 hypothetical protein BCV69DRAFT_300360 [Pseudomicrostroma glucosiphilum]